MPNVDLATQLVDMTQAVHSFRANLAVFRAASHMSKTLLDIFT